MAKASAPKRTQNKVDLDNLSERDRDILTMETKDAMKKYNSGKQGIYDRRFALNKKIKAAGLTVEQLLNTEGASQPEKQNTAGTKVKRGRPQKTEQPIVTKAEEKELGSEVVNYQQPLSVNRKPITINFETFSVILNSVPQKISVNPETNAIEIDV